MMLLQGAGIGDIFLSSAVVNHDRRIPIPGFDVYGVGRFECPPCPNLQVGRFCVRWHISVGAYPLSPLHGKEGAGRGVGLAV